MKRSLFDDDVRMGAITEAELLAQHLFQALPRIVEDDGVGLERCRVVAFAHPLAHRRVPGVRGIRDHAQQLIEAEDAAAPLRRASSIPTDTPGIPQGRVGTLQPFVCHHMLPVGAEVVRVQGEWDVPRGATEDVRQRNFPARSDRPVRGFVGGSPDRDDALPVGVEKAELVKAAVEPAMASWIATWRSRNEYACGTCRRPRRADWSCSGRSGTVNQIGAPAAAVGSRQRGCPGHRWVPWPCVGSRREAAGQAVRCRMTPMSSVAGRDRRSPGSALRSARGDAAGARTAPSACRSVESAKVFGHVRAIYLIIICPPTKSPHGPTYSLVHPDSAPNADISSRV